MKEKLLLQWKAIGRSKLITEEEEEEENSNACLLGRPNTIQILSSA